MVTLSAAQFETPLGIMLAITDGAALCQLSFLDGPRLKQSLDKLCQKKRATIVEQPHWILTMIQKEMNAYFLGELSEFKTPFIVDGTPFQKSVWQQLSKITYGQTSSYRSKAEAIGHPKAFRAVANAHGKNPLTIVIPCHRVMNYDGTLGGYSPGIAKKSWLIAHEKNHAH